ncbi:hypothetical protein PsYK624_056360 [Phanerochaete sordida]|uniref:Ribosomal protein L10 n=1 Tax=Phanerochaete sordida TaxID=48140 RepID=A0A9P3G821_9APHY|nr:hypothetical protein PsYK624_056360 [Phanerochaete sordida]
MLSSLARPLRAACPSSSSAGPSTLSKRTIASVTPAYVFPGKHMPRKYPERKRYKVDEYTRLLDSSKTHPLILFKHVDFSVKRLTQLRKDIAAAALKHVPKPKPSLAAPTPAPAPAAEPALPQFVVASTPFFGVALREHPAFDDATRRAIAEMVDGTLAVLTFPELNPPQLQAVLAVLARTVPPRVPKSAEQIAKEKKEAEANYVPGRRPKGAKPEPVPDLRLVGAIIEGRAFKVDAVKDVAKLPTLDQLRAQIVGLLSAPAAQLTAVLNEASGARLARTLEGLKKSLEEGQSDAPPS